MTSHQSSDPGPDRSSDLGTDAVVDRLKAFGAHPVRPPVASAHLSALAAARPRRRGWTKAKVGAAFFAGLLLGGTGLATAGALPGEAQDVAHDVLGVVGLDVPRSTEGCPEGQTFTSHGDYVSAVARGEIEGEVSEAAQSACGKPVAGADADPEPGTAGAENRSECAPPWAGGKPAWAGPGLTAEQRQALKDEAHASWVQPESCADETADIEETEPVEVEEEGVGEGAPPEVSGGGQPPVVPPVEPGAEAVEGAEQQEDADGADPAGNAGETGEEGPPEGVPPTDG